MPRENFLVEARTAHASIMVHVSKKTKIQVSGMHESDD